MFIRYSWPSSLSFASLALLVALGVTWLPIHPLQAGDQVIDPRRDDEEIKRVAVRRARERLQNCPIEKLYVTNTIPVANPEEIGILEIIDIAELLGEAILRIHANRSVSSLFI